MRRYILSAASVVIGYFVARLADEVIGLDDLAADVGRWIATTFPVLRYEGRRP